MMKKFGKIFLIVAVVVIAMLAMMTVASAASISGVSTGIASGEGRTISVTVTYDSPAAAQQSTILVVPAGTDIATLADSAIKYIDQETVSEGTVTYNFKLLEADRKGAYDVYVGGTDVDAPSKSAVSFDARKILGTITVLGDATKATAKAVANGVETPGTVASDGKYEIVVGQGTYNVVLGKKGYLYKTFENVAVGAEDQNLGTTVLIAGDVTGDSKIDLEDLQQVLSSIGTNLSDLDLNDDGKIDLEELQTVLTNIGQSSK